jgi:hypothetical protein
MNINLVNALCMKIKKGVVEDARKGFKTLKRKTSNHRKT